MIIIHAFAQKLRNGKENPKNFPYWGELISKIKEPIIQVGIEGERQLVPDFRKNLSIKELSELLGECRTWISIDSFFQHLAWKVGKPGIVIWGKGDPTIFGHEENTNLLKDFENVRKNQFATWEEEEFDPSVFISADEVLKNI